jgi:serine protease Do
VADFEGVKGKDVYQMETSVNRGNSGGPLLDGNGYLVGINTSISRRSADGLAITGINFAIKSAVVRRWISESREQIASAPELAPDALPAAAAVASAQPQPPPTEDAPAQAAPPRPPLPTQSPAMGPEDRRITVSLSAPPPPPLARRGFTSKEKPGRVLSPQELVKEHASAAFDDLERESQKHKTK